jgi:hypothetical protein
MKLKTYDYHEKVEFQPHSLELRDLLKKYMNKEYIVQFFKLMVLREDGFNETNAQLFKGNSSSFVDLSQGFSQILQDDFLTMCKNELKNLLKHVGSSTREEIFHVTTLSEFIGGMIRGMKHWSNMEMKDKTVFLHHYTHRE